MKANKNIDIFLIELFRLKPKPKTAVLTQITEPEN